LHAVPQVSLDGRNFEAFVSDFAALHGPGTDGYPAHPGVARVVKSALEKISGEFDEQARPGPLDLSSSVHAHGTLKQRSIAN
jgi:hypothetical protein